MVEESGGWPLVSRLLEQLELIGQSCRASDEEAAPEEIAPLAVRWVLEQARVGAAIVGSSPNRDLSLDQVFGLSEESVRRLCALSLAELRHIPGDVYQLERDRDGLHGRIMKYNLQAD